MHWIARFVFWLSPHRTICGTHVRISPFCDSKQVSDGFAKMQEALSLIRDHAPVRFRQVQRDIRTFWILGTPIAYGSYIRALGVCELWYRYVLLTRTTPADLASTIVHEAQHARLARLGFKFEDPYKERMEYLCFKASRNFGLRLPDGTELIRDVDYALTSGKRLTHTTTSLLRARVAALYRTGGPLWWKNLLRRGMVKRARKELHARLRRKDP
jgi:hypothetical protein